MEESAQALGDVVLYSVEHDDFEKLLSYRPELADLVGASCSVVSTLMNDFQKLRYARLYARANMH